MAPRRVVAIGVSRAKSAFKNQNKAWPSSRVVRNTKRQILRPND